MSLISSQKVDTNQHMLEIGVDADTFKAATIKAYKKNVSKIAIPGFRKGKAPKNMIEKMYGEDFFHEEAVNLVYADAYQAAIEESGINPVDYADVTDVKIDKETGLTFKATVTVKPEVEVADYKGIKVEKTVHTVTGDEIHAEIEKLQDRNSRVISVEDRAAQIGDTAVINFEGFADGVPFEGGKGEAYPLVLGSDSFIPGFEEQVAGKKIGESFDVNVTFPAEYHVDDLAGKPVRFAVDIVELKAKELPELDDEFAKDVSEFETLEEFKEDLRKNLQEKADKHAEDGVENALIDAIVENMKAEIPAIMVKNKVEELVRDFEYRLKSQGMTLELYLQYTGSTMEMFQTTFAAPAEKQVKVALALEKIVELEEIAVSLEEIEAEYEKVAKAYEMEAEKVKKLVAEKDITKDLAINKAIDLIRQSAVITEAEEAAKPATEEVGETSAAKKAPVKKKK